MDIKKLLVVVAEVWVPKHNFSFSFRKVYHKFPLPPTRTLVIVKDLDNFSLENTLMLPLQ